MARLYGELCNHLPAGSVTVYTMHADAPQPPGNVPVLRMPFNRNYAGNVVSVARWARALSPFLSSAQFAAIHAGNIRPTGYIAAWARARYGIPYLLYVHGKDVLKETGRIRKSARRRWLARRIFGAASAIIANSEHVADLTRSLLAELGCLNADVVRVVHPGTDPQRFNPDADGASAWRQRLAIRGPMLLSIARLVPRKGIDTMIAALPNLLRDFPDLQFVVGGEGADLERLNAMAASLGVSEHVRFIGAVPDSELAALYSAADVFALPAREVPSRHDVEGFGIVYCEASACGVPVVSLGTGGTRDAVRDGETGIILPSDEPAEVAAAIGGLLKDPERRRAMGEAGRKAVESYYNWSRAAAEITAVLEEITQAQPLPSPPRR